MTALWLDPAPRFPTPPGWPDLRLVGGGAGPDLGEEDLAPVHTRASQRRRASVAVRRRRTLLAIMALLLVALALPLGGTGGHSHPAGSALAENGRPASYVVQPGDTLWSIAQRVAPGGDPRPLVAELASKIGSDRVVPGERITLP